MKRWQWTWRRATQHVGHAELTLLFLLGLVLVLQQAGIAPRQARLAQQESALTRFTQALSAAQARPVALPAAKDELPGLASLTAQLGTLHKVAAAEGVALPQADYQLSREGGRFWRYQIRSEGEFAFPAVLKMLDHGMTALPNLAVDRLAIDRSTVDVGRPHIKLELSLYFAGPADQDGAP